jgi:quercetin dioxygenase-like cupin family protein
MAIPHASPAEVVDIRPLGPQLAGAETTTLIKTYAVEVIRMVLEAGKEVPPHALAREVILQCLEGRVEVRTGARRSMLEAGYLLYLEGHQEYALAAVTDSSLLVTILLAHKPPEETAPP